MDTVAPPELLGQQLLDLPVLVLSNYSAEVLTSATLAITKSPDSVGLLFFAQGKAATLLLEEITSEKQ
eukprot:508540-Amphidinium_carterae.1